MSGVIAVTPSRKLKKISQNRVNKQGPDYSNAFTEGSPLYFEDPSDTALTFEVSRFSFATGRWGK